MYVFLLCMFNDNNNNNNDNNVCFLLFQVSVREVTKAGDRVSIHTYIHTYIHTRPCIDVVY